MMIAICTKSSTSGAFANSCRRVQQSHMIVALELDCSVQQMEQFRQYLMQRQVDANGL